MRLRFGTLMLALAWWPGSALTAGQAAGSVATTGSQEMPEVAAAAVPRARSEAALEEPDPRWEAFLGCWSPLVAEAAGATTGGSQRTLCFRPRDDVSVVRSVVIDGEVRDERVIQPDGSIHQVRRDGCAGTETALWSGDGKRVYLRSTLRCVDHPHQREVADVLALGGAGTLVEIHSDGGDRYPDGEDPYAGEGDRYEVYRSLDAADYPPSMREVSVYSDEPTRLYAASPLSLDDIVEAAGLLPASIVKAMAFHLPTRRFHVDADALVALDEAGLGDEVIDVVVAAAYPEKFDVVIEPYDDRAAGYTDAADDPYSAARSGWGWSGFGRRGYDSPYGYSPYGYYGRFRPRFRDHGTIVVIDRDDVDAARPRGIAVNGRGYTRAGPPSFDSSAGGSSSTSYGGRWGVNRGAGSSGSGGSASGGDDGGDRGTPPPRKARPKT